MKCIKNKNASELIFMKILISGIVTAMIFAVAASGQSGRRIASTPTPTPPPRPVEDQFSDSKILPPRVRVTKPKFKNSDKNDPVPTTQNAEADADSDEDTIRVETNLVTIPVSVLDRNGLYVPTLSKESFRIFENGKEQQIEFFADAEVPISVILLLDMSYSSERKIDLIKQAAIAFVDRLNPEDRVSVIEFYGNYRTLVEMTTNRDEIYRGIRKARIDSGTSIYDTVEHSVRKLIPAIEGRKAIVLFTDGVDTTSRRSNYDRSIDYAEESEAPIFPIYFNTFMDQQNMSIGVQPNTRGEYALGRNYLKELADYTGGAVYDSASTPGGLVGAFEAIADELRKQYVIGYIPQDKGTPGERRSIKVRINRPNLVIRARDSYIVGKTK